MKKTTIYLFILFLLYGCASIQTQRQYYKIAKGGSGNLEVDKAQCAYQAELNTPIPSNNKVIINSSNYNTYSSGGIGGGFASGFASAEASAAPKRRKNRLIDLCLKSRGWQWNTIDMQKD